MRSAQIKPPGEQNKTLLEQRKENKKKKLKELFNLQLTSYFSNSARVYRNCRTPKRQQRKLGRDRETMLSKKMWVGKGKICAQREYSEYCQIWPILHLQIENLSGSVSASFFLSIWRGEGLAKVCLYIWTHPKRNRSLPRHSLS